MAIRINHSKKTVTLGVGDILDENAGRAGMASGISFFARASLGREAHAAHQRTQADLLEGYHREMSIQYATTVDDYTVKVQGRIDGVYEREGRTVVEEIKSVVKAAHQFEELSVESFPHYAAQLRLYCFFLKQQGAVNVEGRLVFSNVVDGAKKQLAIQPPFDDVESLIVNRVRALLAMSRAEERRQAERKIVSAAVSFPFPSPRPHQDEMMAAIEHVLGAGKHLMVCAPSGIGKTAGALYPAVKFALANEKRVFFATAKNTQQEIAWQTLQQIHSTLQRSNTPSLPSTILPFSHSPCPFSALRLRAKEQICINDVYACHEEFCPQLRQVEEKFQSLNVEEQLQRQPFSDPDHLTVLGRELRLCPFDLAMLRSQQVDVVVCDYNYIFDPAVYLRHFFHENEHDDAILILDEAHNLYERARDYYSPSLQRADIRACLQLLPFDEMLARDLAGWLRSLEKLFGALSATGKEQFGNEKKYPVELTRAVFFRKRDEAERLAMRYFLYRVGQRRPTVDNPLDEFLKQFFVFANTLELAGADAPQLEDEFSFIFDRTESQQIKILCKDPSRLLKKRLNSFHSVIAMSATLEPMEFYREALGFDVKRTEYLTLPSPFPRGNRKIVVVPTLSTTFRARDRSYQKLAAIIADVVAQRHGNYALFFPSYEYLQNTEPFLQSMLDARTYNLELIVQERAMTQEARDTVMNQLREESRGKVVLAVQGGIFSEGVDFAGETLIGVIVVSPALPTFDFERELMRAYYERRNGQGFEFAYLYPGMTRVIQSVGRLIRSATDRGVAVLICNRFAQSQYSALFPRDWYVNDPRELIVENLGEELRDFWERNRSQMNA